MAAHIARQRSPSLGCGAGPRAEKVDRSAADWPVNEKLRAKVEPINRPHFIVDTSRDVRPIVYKVVREARR